MDWLCIIGILIIFGFLGAAVAGSRGNGGFSGFVLGLLLGPLGLLIVAVSPKNEDVLREREQRKEEDLEAAGELRKCPYCAEYVKPEAQVCRYCQRELPPIEKILKKCQKCDTLLEITQAQLSEGLFVCPECRHTNRL